MVELIRLEKSKRKNKRYDAIFRINDNLKRVPFGSSEHENYTIHKDKQRRQRYRKRHINDNLTDPMSPGSLSWFILWGDSVSLNDNIKNFKNKFKI